jgi:transcriptional regulator with XRE-family HTH domain
MNTMETNLSTIIKRQRVMVPLTLRELAARAGVSASHLGRIERGERFPSANILRKIARPLGFDEDELFMLAGYLSPGTPT